MNLLVLKNRLERDLAAVNVLIEDFGETTEVDGPSEVPEEVAAPVSAPRKVRDRSEANPFNDAVQNALIKWPEEPFTTVQIKEHLLDNRPEFRTQLEANVTSMALQREFNKGRLTRNVVPGQRGLTWVKCENYAERVAKDN
jgi:hypothetical protein